jgi:hypothetical protein
MNETVKVGAYARPSSTARTETAVPAPGRTPEYYVDAEEAAKFLDIHRRTVLHMARDGIIPAHPWAMEDENNGDYCCRNWTSGCAVG